MTSKGQGAYRNMSKYSIKDLERLSGIKAHTIRIWEQRYNLISPERTDTNIRYYTDEDLKFIMNIAVLNANGVKISRISSMSKEQIAEEVSRVTAKSNDQENLISALIISTIDLNHAQFEMIYQQSLIKIGLEATFSEIIQPFLERIGNLWLTGSITPAQEHFISNLIRQKLIVAIDAQPKKSKSGSNKILVYTPENEYHEIAILYADYVFRKHEQEVFYLGTNVPFENLGLVVDKHHIEILYFNVTSNPSGNTLKSYLEKLDSRFPHQKIAVSGYQIEKHPEFLPERFVVVRSAEEIQQLFKK